MKDVKLELGPAASSPFWQDVAAETILMLRSAALLLLLEMSALLSGCCFYSEHLEMCANANCSRNCSNMRSPMVRCLPSARLASYTLCLAASMWEMSK